MNNYFDEKSSKWIRSLKAYVICLFFICIIYGLVFGIVDACTEVVIESPVLALLVWPFAGCILAFTILIPGMLLINALNNLQVIREKVEQLTNPVKQENNVDHKTSSGFIVSDNNNESINKKIDNHNDFQLKIDNKKEINNKTNHSQVLNENIVKTNNEELSNIVKFEKTNSKNSLSFADIEEYVKENYPDEYDAVISFVSPSNKEDYESMIKNIYDNKK